MDCRKRGRFIFYGGCVILMIKNKKLWEEFNKEWILKRKISLKRRVKIYDGLYELAKDVRNRLVQGTLLGQTRPQILK